MENVLLELKAKHFINADYDDIFNCPICKAAKEQLGHEKLSEGAISLTLYDEKNDVVINYRHSIYGHWDFKSDVKVAKLAESETVIRTIELIPQS